MRRLKTALLIGITAAAGCAVGPDYVSPGTDAGEWVNIGDETGAVEIAWWRSFGDADLDRYLQAAMQANRDVRVARARLQEAAALRSVARSVFWPGVSAGAGYTWFDQSLNTPTGAGPLVQAGLASRDGEFWTTVAQASWEPDLFGGNRRRAQSATARAEAAAFAHEGMKLSVIAEVASSYMELRGAQSRLQIARKNVGLLQESLDLTTKKVRVGLSPQLDELRARAQVAATSAILPMLNASIRASAHRLAVLTGQSPEALLDELLAPAPLPDIPATVAVGTRAEVLRRRPDVRASERQLAAAVADVGVATAAFFPRLVIGVQGGFESSDTGNLIDSGSRLLNAAPSLTVPLFQGGALKANKNASDARAVAALASYEQSVLRALEDAESALAAFAEERNTLTHLTEASRASADAAEIASRLYDTGLGDFFTVLDAERQLVLTQDARAQSETRLRVALVRLYKALGGGWSSGG